MKTYFNKHNPKIILYQKDKNYNNLLLQEEYLSKLKRFTTKWKYLKDSCFQIFHSLPPLKEKYVLANQESFMNKELQKAIMIWSKLGNTFLKDKTESSKKIYCKQRYVMLTSYSKLKKQYYSILDVSKVADNKKFWKTSMNLFSDKLINFETITLPKNIMIISDNKKTANIFVEYFDTTVSILGWALPQDVIIATDGIRTDLKIKEGFVTFLSHAKKLTMSVEFSGLLSTFWCHSYFQYLKVQQCRFENLPICLCSYENNILNVSLS